MRVVRVVLVVLVGALGLVALASGISGMVLGPSDVVDPSFALDSNFRFLSAFLTGAGLVLLWSLTRLNRARVELRFVCALVFAGGCARLLSLATAGQPSAAYVAYLVAELVLPPVIVALHARLPTVSEASSSEGIGSAARP
jgi:hypothetical protein